MPIPRQYATNADRQAAYRERRRALASPVPVSSIPGYRRWALLLQQAQQCLDHVAEEMVAYWDERCERWQNSERGEEFTERVELLEELQERLRELVEA
jgi:hypothetical protein